MRRVGGREAVAVVVQRGGPWQRGEPGDGPDGRAAAEHRAVGCEHEQRGRQQDACDVGHGEGPGADTGALGDAVGGGDGDGGRCCGGGDGGGRDGDRERHGPVGVPDGHEHGVDDQQPDACIHADGSGRDGEDRGGPNMERAAQRGGGVDEDDGAHAVGGVGNHLPVAAIEAAVARPAAAEADEHAVELAEQQPAVAGDHRDDWRRRLVSQERRDAGRADVVDALVVVPEIAGPGSAHKNLHRRKNDAAPGTPRLGADSIRIAWAGMSLARYKARTVGAVIAMGYLIAIAVTALALTSMIVPYAVMHRQVQAPTNEDATFTITFTITVPPGVYTTTIVDVIKTNWARILGIPASDIVVAFPPGTAVPRGRRRAVDDAELTVAVTVTSQSDEAPAKLAIMSRATVIAEFVADVKKKHGAEITAAIRYVTVISPGRVTSALAAAAPTIRHNLDLITAVAQCINASAAGDCNLTNSRFRGVPSSWSTTGVTSMASLFKDKGLFNANISSWDTSAVTTMESMFEGATKFNGSITQWVVSEVETMERMFKNATTFNQDLNWVPRAVKSMESMFEGAVSFNGSITNWVVSEVETMERMFFGATTFDRDLNWVPGAVKSMESMFEGAVSFNGSITNWVVSEVETMERMFFGATNFNRDLNWVTAEVAIMASMFQNASAFDRNITGWKLPRVTNASASADAFTGATAWNLKYRMVNLSAASGPPSSWTSTYG